MKIGNRTICRSSMPLVIAEIGINHSGSLQIAFEMVDAAHRAGIEIIKHQTHIVEDEMSTKAREVIPGNADESIYSIMERCALNEQEEKALQQYVTQKGMVFISTPFSRAAVDRLERLKVPAYKIGSGEMNNLPLVDYIASKGKPIIMSTGMNALDDVKESVALIQKHQVPLALMHTTNLYPTPPELVRLGALKELMEAFPDLPVGLSDHSLGNYACWAAVALGAAVVERHFTDNYQRKGPDIICSMDENEAMELLYGIEQIYKMQGGTKVPAEEEKVTSDFAFATMVAVEDIPAGEELTARNTWVKRPGIEGIPAKHYPHLLGRRVIHQIPKDQHINWNDLEKA